MSVLERFEKFISYCPNTGCWLWTGAMVKEGYGAFKLEGKRMSAHRVAYTLFVGEIPDGLHIDHLCRNRACVNPAHLQPVTQRENTLRGESPIAEKARQDYCKRGHRLPPPNANGKRECKECRHIRQDTDDYREWHRKRTSELRKRWGGRKAPERGKTHQPG